MKIDIREHHPSGRPKHKIQFYDNGYKENERFFDENGYLHNINAPANQYWYDNGFKHYVAYLINGSFHNISNPTRIEYSKVGKITGKESCIIDKYFDQNKLNWQNCIKNI
jgi:hypothetical protein